MRQIDRITLSDLTGLCARPDGPIMAHRVRCCGASECRLTGELRKWLACARNVEDDPTETLVARHDDPFPGSIPAPSRVLVFVVTIPFP
jgi:hypothetical protein